MSARLFVNISQSYITFYVQYTVVLSADMIAIIPLIMYVAGFSISLVLKFVTDKFGYKIAFVLSCIVGIGKILAEQMQKRYFTFRGILFYHNISKNDFKGGCAWIWFSCEKCGSEYNIFGIAIMMGAGGSAMLINSLAIVASLIGNNLGKNSVLF